MDFFHGAIAILSGVVLILAALVAWLYLQQSRTIQALNTLALAITAPPVPPQEVHNVHVDTVAASAASATTPAEDDRVSVYEEDDDMTTVVEESLPVLAEIAQDKHEDEDEFSSKTVAQLRDLLSAKGIPFNKTDKKPMLLSLLKATA